MILQYKISTSPTSSTKYNDAKYDIDGEFEGWLKIDSEPFIDIDDEYLTKHEYDHTDLIVQTNIKLRTL